MTNQPFNFPISGNPPNEFAESTAFSTAINRAIGFATTNNQQRPGKFPDQYTSLITGAGDGAGIAGEIISDSEYGETWEVTGSGIVALRSRVAIEEGAVFFARYLRTTNPSDPSGDTVRFRVRWLNSSYGSVGTSTIRSDALTVAQGFIEAFGSVNIEDATLEAPVGAVYAAPFIETFGADGKTRIVSLGTRTAKVLEADIADVANEALNVDAENVNFPDPEFQWPDEVIPEFPVARTFYVTMDGDDANTGTSTSKPFLTVNRALQAMDAEAPNPCVAIVHPGEYIVQPDSVVPKNCALYGYDLRVTELRLPPGQEINNMFLMSSGIKVRGFTFIGMRHEAQAIFDPFNKDYVPPEKGYSFVFKPGEIITRSPYIADCTTIGANTQDVNAMRAPIDVLNNNPLVPNGGGNILADGSVLDLNSPLRSVVVDSFTAVNPNGMGYVIKRNAIAQLVSVFTNWNRVGVWCHEGGQATLANSNNSFGDFSLVAIGSRLNILIPTTLPDLVTSTAAADIIDNNFEAIVAASQARFEQRAWWNLFTQEQQEQTVRDTRTLLRFVSGDFRSGQDRGTQTFIKGLFDWNADYVFNPTAAVGSQTLLQTFLEGFEDIEAELAERFDGLGQPVSTMKQNLFGLIDTVLNNPQDFRVPFRSTLEFAGQQLSYAGTGVNYNALPANQRGTGVVPDPLGTIIQDEGGRCYGTFSTEAGDTYLGRDLRVDFERSTIEGQAFERGVQNTALPLTFALGGI